MDVDLFSEGSIYYYTNKSHTKEDYRKDSINHDFLVSRPVYVLKSNPTPFECFTINVLAITSSSNRVGIPININGIIDGKILPFAIHSVHKDNLTKYMGRASDEIIQSVSQATKYHQGFTDVIPEYVQEYIDYMDRINNKIKQMSVKEKSVYLFIKDVCEHKPTSVIPYDDLFKEYKNHTRNTQYTRTQDFSKVLKRHIDDFPQVHIEIENKITYVHGLSVKVHKSNNQSQTQTKKTVIGDSAKLYNNITDNSQLYSRLTKRARNIYDRLDIVQKISNYHKDYRTMDIAETLNEEDKIIMKRMIVNDVDRKKQKIFRRLDNGESPLNMKTTDQYLMYVCSINELREHISEKYIKRNSINYIRKELKQNVKHYFVKVDM